MAQPLRERSSLARGLAAVYTQLGFPPGKGCPMPLQNILLTALALILFPALFWAGKRGLIRRKWIRRALYAAGAFLSAGLLIWGLLFWRLPPLKATGPYAISSQVLQLKDAGARKLAVLAVYPDAPDLSSRSLPLVLFSHGGLSTMHSNQSLYEELASHGYIVASVSHTDHALSSPVKGGRVFVDRDYLGEISRENSHEDTAYSLRCYRKWMALRIQDLSFVLDSLLSGGGGALFCRLIDPGRIGLAGHSLGGAAAYGLARQRQDIRAVMALESPYLADITGTDGSDFVWNTAPYRCALMNVYSDAGLALMEHDHKYAQNRRLQAPGMGAAAHHLPGSNHFTLTDLSRLSPPLCRLLGGRFDTPGEETLAAVNRLALAFFDAHLAPPRGPVD